MADSVIKYSDLIGEDNTFEVLFQNIAQLKEELQELATILKGKLDVVNPNNEAAVQGITKETQNLVKAMKKLSVEEKKAARSKKKLEDLSREELILREKQKIANRERVQEAKQEAILQDKRAGHIEKLRAELSLTTLKWKKLSEAELKNKDVGGKLIKDKKRLTEELKKLEKQTGDNRRNVGNYSDALKGLGGNFSILGVTMNGIVGTFKNLLGIFPAIIGGFKTLRGAIMSTGIGALVIAFASLVTFLARTQRGLDFVKKAFAGVTATIDVIIDRIAKFGEAIGAAFSGDFSRAAELFKQSVSGIGDEIAKESKQAMELEKALQRVADREIEMIRIRADKLLQIKKLEEEATINEKKDKKRAIEAIKQAKQVAKELMDAEVSLAAERLRIKKTQNEMTESTREDLKEEAQLYADLVNIKEQEAGKQKKLQARLNTLTTVTKKNTKATEKNTKTFKDNTDLRLKAIVNLQNKIAKAEAGNVEDKTKKLLALEDAKYKTLQTKRKSEFDKDMKLIQDNEDNIIEFHTKASDEYKLNLIKKEQEIRLLKQLYLKLGEEDLKASEDKKNKIIDDSFKAQSEATIKAYDIELEEMDEQDQKKAKKETDAILRTMGWRSEEEEREIEFQRKLTDMELDNIEDVNERKIKIQREAFKREREDILANEKYTAEQRNKLIEQLDEKSRQYEASLSKKRTDDLMKNMQEVTEKISQVVIDVFEKASETSTDLVEDQAEAVDKQRERAEKGLTNTLDFEQEQLAKREAEQIRAEKRAKNAAEVMALYNLVSAHASSGDKNALTRGLIDWSILKALSEVLDSGFEEGGWTGDYGTKQVAGVVHGKEYVVTASDVAKYGLAGKSGSEFGEAMSDYFYSPLQQNLYPNQNANFRKGLANQQKTYESLENEVKAMRVAFENSKNTDYDILRMTDYFVEISKRVTNNRMTTVNKQRKRL